MTNPTGKSIPSISARLCHLTDSFLGPRRFIRGQGGIRTPEGVSQQIYSLPRLTTSVPTQFRETIFSVFKLKV